MSSNPATPMLSLGVSHKQDPPQQAPQRNYNLKEISNAVDAHDDASFQSSTFALKRTRSLGLLDPFITPPTTDAPSQEPQTEKANKTPAEQQEPDDTEFQTPAKSPISIASCDSAYSKDYRSSSPSSLSSTSSLTGTPELGGVHDDSVLQYEPSCHVDYLSHDWKESDISACWRNIVSRRRDVTNSARLENASWRTWTKAKYNLRTVAPESVNWLKDCDITWLYGPLYNQPANVVYNEPLPHDLAVDKVTVVPVPGHKPILKKRTVGDKILARQAGHSSHSPDHNACQHASSKTACPKSVTMVDTSLSHGEASRYLRHHNYRHRPHTGQPDENISRQINLQYCLMKGYSASQASSFVVSARSSAVSMEQFVQRRIHFNDRVEQCIAVEADDGDEVETLGRRNKFDLCQSSDSEVSDSDSEGEDTVSAWTQKDNLSDVESDMESDDDEPGLFLMLRSTSSASLHRRDGLTTLKSASTSDLPHTIALLPATTLKYALDDEETKEREAEVATTVAYAMSHNTQSRRHIYTGYDYNSVYESPSHSPAPPKTAGGAQNIDPRSIIGPSSLLDTPSCVAMPQHLCGNLVPSGEVVLPPVAGPSVLEEAEEVTVPSVAFGSDFSYGSVGARMATGAVLVQEKNALQVAVQEIVRDSSPFSDGAMDLAAVANDAIDNRNGNDNDGEADEDDDAGVTARLVTSAKGLAQGIWPGGWTY